MFQLNGFLSNKCTFIRLLICKHIICLSTGQHLFGVRSSKRTTWGPRPSAKLDTTESVAHSNSCSVSFNSGEQASSSKDSHHLTLSSITDMQTYSYANLLVSIYLGYDLLREQHADQESPSAKLDTTESSNTCSVSFNSGELASSSKDSHHLTLSLPLWF